MIEEIGKVFSPRSLALEDITDVAQRPKWEEYIKGYLMSLNAVTWSKQDRPIEIERVSVFTGDSFVLSFQEKQT